MINMDESTPVVDQVVIKQLRKIDPQNKRNLVQRLVEMYMENAPTLVSELRQDIANSDWDHLRELVHRFKTQNANLGLRRMQQLLINIEAEDLSADEKAEAVRLLEEELGKAMNSLRKL